MSYCRFSSDDPERWLDVDGWPYAVSSHGRVKRTVPGGSPIAKAGRFMTPSPNRHGYLMVTLSRNAEVKQFGVANLVCAAFHGAAPADGMEVRHLDGVRTHNWPLNLAWGTRKQNSDDKDAHGRLYRGEQASKAKLTQDDVDRLRSEYKQALIGRKRVPKGWLAMKAAEYGVTTHSVSAISRGAGYNVPQYAIDALREEAAAP